MFTFLNNNEKESDKIEEDRHEINTKKSTAWAMAVFKDWLMEKKMSTKFENYGAETLNQTLAFFLCWCKKQQGTVLLRFQLHVSVSS